MINRKYEIVLVEGEGLESKEPLKNFKLFRILLPCYSISSKEWNPGVQRAKAGLLHPLNITAWPAGGSSGCGGGL